MALQNNNITITQVTDYNPSFNWQVGLSSNNISPNNILYRATIRPLNGYEQYSRVPSSEVLYEENGIVIDASTHQGFWSFPLSTNASISGGPFRDYQVVIEGHDINGNTSAGNLIETNNENGWIAFNKGYDVIAISNPRQTGIEMSNNIPTQYASNTGIGDTGFYLNSGNGYNTLNYMGTHGEINIRYLGGNFNSNLVGGYIYAWTGAFPKLDTLLGINGYNQVSKSQFSFDPTIGNVYNPTAAMAFRGANSVYVSLSFYDNIDQIAINSGINISTGLYLSDNVICYNDIAAGSITIGGFQTIYAMQYAGNISPTGFLGTGVTILARQFNSGISSVLYLANSLNVSGYNSYSGISSLVGGGAGGNAVLLNNSAISSSALITALIPIMTSNTTPVGVASASEEQEPAYFALDGNPATVWQSINISPQWMQYQFSAPKKIYSYDLFIPNSVSATTNYNLQGSNDGSTWTNIDSQSTLYGGTYTVNTSVSYSYYRIYIISCATIGGVNFPPIIDTFQVYGN